ncbi:MAG: type II toxin-antitoxin system prevent-host-death family antitoxin [Ruminococcus sp.]|nr:type II toxin-antitoxin system prevent-host-death family antitoxin [Ruminococcus sp.]
MITVSATDIQNNFGQYLQAVQSGDEVLILKNGKEIARLISNKSAVSYLTDSFIGVLHNDQDEEKIREERLSRYESND